MTVEELVASTLRARAQDVPPGVVVARTAAARARARAITVRRRVAVGAVVAVAALGGTALVRAESLNRADGPDPAGLSDRVVSVKETFAGRTLIDSAETTDGRELTLRAGSASGAEWVVACAGVGDEYSVHVSVDGASRSPSLCAERAGLGDTMRFWVPAAGSGYESEVRLWVTRTGDAAVVSPSDAVLAAAAYALPEPYAHLAGYDIYPLEANFGTEWSVLDSGESAPGQRSYTLEVPLHDGATMLELVSAGTGQATVRLVVDGVRVHTVPATYVLGGRSLGDMLTGGVPHRVTLWIPEEEFPADAQLGIVVRERAG